MAIFGSFPDLHERIDGLDTQVNQMEKLLASHMAKYEQQMFHTLENQKRIEDRLEEQNDIAKAQHEENQKRMRSLQWWLVGAMVALAVSFGNVPSNGLIVEIFRAIAAHGG